jgi:hypothetical protein
VARAQLGPRIRARRSGSFARPYPALLINLALVMWPSTGPVLHGYRKALVIAFKSSVMPAANRANGFKSLAAASSNHCFECRHVQHVNRPADRQVDEQQAITRRLSVQREIIHP